MFRFLFDFVSFRKVSIKFRFVLILFLSVGFVSFWKISFLKISFRSISFCILHVPNKTQVNWSIYLILENIWLLFYISFLIYQIYIWCKPVQGLYCDSLLIPRIETEVCMTRNLFMLKRNVFILRCTGFCCSFYYFICCVHTCTINT